ncbi:MAG: sugar phosphate isomerase/epimerase family protein [Anaerolineae bacterium]
MLSITTDYACVDKGDPSPYLRRIADAGFTHVHWCHHWNTDFIYSRWEIEQIGRWLNEYGLKLLDLHAPVGPEKNWASEKEWERLAGVEIVRNRIEMTARLGGDAVIMHLPNVPGWEPLRRSLDELEGFARDHGIRIALENGPLPVIGSWLAEYDAGYLGLCYDSGHGNLVADGLDQLERLKDRLIAVHLHDNDGSADQHNLIFTGTVDWGRLARILAASAYRKPISSESNMGRAGIADETVFLQRAYEAGRRLTAMVEDARNAQDT